MLAHMFADRITRECSADGDYESALKSTTDAVKPGDVVKLRDRDEFYAKCMPALSRTSCRDLLAGKLPTSCMGQCVRE